MYSYHYSRKIIYLSQALYRSPGACHKNKKSTIKQLFYLISLLGLVTPPLLELERELPEGDLRLGAQSVHRQGRVGLVDEGLQVLLGQVDLVLLLLALVGVGVGEVVVGVDPPPAVEEAEAVAVRVAVVVAREPVVLWNKENVLRMGSPRKAVNSI